MNKFIPKSYKFKKIRKRVRTKLMFERRVISLKNYQFGLKSLDNGVISSVVLEAVRRSITKRLKRIGRLKINNFPYIPLTAKSLGVRMGKGVGSISS
jgi:large subunit ribosomal protein L16